MYTVCDDSVYIMVYYAHVCEELFKPWRLNSSCGWSKYTYNYICMYAQVGKKSGKQHMVHASHAYSVLQLEKESKLIRQ